MKIQDFEDSQRFLFVKEVVLNGWQIAGKQFPKVSQYLERETLVMFEVSFDGGQYRSTASPVTVHEVLACGAWKHLG